MERRRHPRRIGEFEFRPPKLPVLPPDEVEFGSRMGRSEKEGCVVQPYAPADTIEGESFPRCAEFVVGVQIVFVLDHHQRMEKPRLGLKSQMLRMSFQGGRETFFTSTSYLTTFSGGRKFSITHSSLLDPSLTLNAKWRLSG